ncbi:MAG: hypothetical protein A2Y56_11950 [Candidatus Aminicenantes bacterium RBG_13_63_10]|nr:MAG: hypothetical protein A2Y56_11950 [Candidatus Aminicenantes bacterium RBG_13_63_10]
MPDDMPEIVLERGDIPLIDLLVEKKLVGSRGEAKRLIQQGGVTLDNRRVDDIAEKIALPAGRPAVLKLGKRKFFRLTART